MDDQGRISQPRHCWYLGPDNFLSLRATLYFEVYLAASLALMLDVISTAFHPPVVTTKSISRYCQVSPEGQVPLIKNHQSKVMKRTPDNFLNEFHVRTGTSQVACLEQACPLLQLFWVRWNQCNTSVVYGLLYFPRLQVVSHFTAYLHHGSRALFCLFTCEIYKLKSVQIPGKIQLRQCMTHGATAVIIKTTYKNKHHPSVKVP